MKLIQFDKDEHYNIIKSWWEDRGFPPADPELLAPIGVMVLVDDKPVCAGFLIRTDAKIAILGNFVSDKHAPKEIRSECIDQLIITLSSIAEKQGFKLLSAGTNLDKLISRYESLGFVKTDHGVTHLGRVLCQ